MNMVLDVKLNIINQLGFDVTIKWGKEIYASLDISSMYDTGMETILFRYNKKDKEEFQESINNFCSGFFNWRNEHKKSIDEFFTNRTEENLMYLEKFYVEI